jgi:hypothetical protein
MTINQEDDVYLDIRSIESTSFFNLYASFKKGWHFLQYEKMYRMKNTHTHNNKRCLFKNKLRNCIYGWWLVLTTPIFG